MSTAIEEREDTATDGLYVQSLPNVMFKSRRKGLRLTVTPRYTTRNPVSGQPTGETKGIFIAFLEGPDGGYFSFPATGPVKLVDSLNGGESEMDAEKVLEWLEGHRLFGDRFEGFWREELTAPAVSREELQVLMDAALEFDEDKLRALIEQEEAGWAREDLLSTARGALERIGVAKAKAEEIARAEAGGKE
jgi:hypothetical protein